MTDKERTIAMQNLKLASIGAAIARELKCRPSPDHPTSRWDLANGDKTNIGLALTVIHIITAGGEGWDK